MPSPRATTAPSGSADPPPATRPNFLAVDHYDLGNPVSAVETLNTYVHPSRTSVRHICLCVTDVCP